MKLETEVEGVGPVTLFCVDHSEPEEGCVACGYVRLLSAMPEGERQETLKAWLASAGKIPEPTALDQADGFGGEI